MKKLFGFPAHHAGRNEETHPLRLRHRLKPFQFLAPSAWCVGAIQHASRTAPFSYTGPQRQYPKFTEGAFREWAMSRPLRFRDLIVEAERESWRLDNKDKNPPERGAECWHG